MKINKLINKIVLALIFAITLCGGQINAQETINRDITNIEELDAFFQEAATCDTEGMYVANIKNNIATIEGTDFEKIYDFNNKNCGIEIEGNNNLILPEKGNLIFVIDNYSHNMFKINNLRIKAEQKSKYFHIELNNRIDGNLKMDNVKVDNFHIKFSFEYLIKTNGNINISNSHYKRIIPESSSVGLFSGNNVYINKSLFEAIDVNSIAKSKENMNNELVNSYLQNVRVEYLLNTSGNTIPILSGNYITESSFFDDLADYSMYHNTIHRCTDYNMSNAVKKMANLSINSHITGSANYGTLEEYTNVEYVDFNGERIKLFFPWTEMPNIEQYAAEMIEYNDRNIVYDLIGRKRIMKPNNIKYGALQALDTGIVEDYNIKGQFTLQDKDNTNINNYVNSFNVKPVVEVSLFKKGQAVSEDPIARSYAKIENIVNETSPNLIYSYDMNCDDFVEGEYFIHYQIEEDVNKSGIKFKVSSSKTYQENITVKYTDKEYSKNLELIDDEAPIVSTSLKYANANMESNKVNPSAITYTYQDTMKLAKCEYKNNDGQWQEVDCKNNKILISDLETTTNNNISLKFIDFAKNETVIDDIIFEIDNVDVDAQAKLNYSNDPKQSGQGFNPIGIRLSSNAKYANKVYFASTKEELKTVIGYTLDSSNQNDKFHLATPEASEGKHTLYYYITTLSGNKSDIKSISYEVDTDNIRGVYKITEDNNKNPSILEITSAQGIGKLKCTIKTNAYDNAANIIDSVEGCDASIDLSNYRIGSYDVKFVVVDQLGNEYLDHLRDVFTIKTINKIKGIIAFVDKNRDIVKDDKVEKLLNKVIANFKNTNEAVELDVVKYNDQTQQLEFDLTDYITSNEDYQLRFKVEDHDYQEGLVLLEDLDGKPKQEIIKGNKTRNIKNDNFNFYLTDINKATITNKTLDLINPTKIDVEVKDLDKDIKVLTKYQDDDDYTSVELDNNLVSFSPLTTQGKHQLMIKVVDLAGNETLETITYIIDTQAPKASVDIKVNESIKYVINDNVDDKLVCKVSIINKKTNKVVKTTTKCQDELSLLNLANGDYQFVINSLKDEANNELVKVTKDFKVNIKPIITDTCTQVKKDKLGRVYYNKVCHSNKRVAKITKYTFKGQSKNYSKVEVSDYSKNKNNRLIRRTTFSNYLNNSNWRKKVVETKKDNNANYKVNRFETYRHNNKKSKKVINIRYYANGKYNNYELITYNAKGKKTYQQVKRYYNNGKLKQRIIYSKFLNGKYRKRVTQNYNSKQVIRRKEVLNLNNRFKWSTRYEYRYNAKGKLKGGKNLKAWRIRLTYNKNGKHLKTVRHDYNAKGKLAKRW